MKRFITVLSSLLVLPAFAEVAPVYYDEIIEYTDDMVGDEDVEQYEDTSDTQTKQNVIQRATPNRSGTASRTMPANTGKTASRANTSSRAVASSPRTAAASGTSRATVSRAAKTANVVSRTPSVTRTVSSRNARSATTTTARVGTMNNSVMPGNHRTSAGMAADTLTDSGTSLYNPSRVGIVNRRSTARLSTATAAVATPTLTEQDVSETTSNLTALSELTDYCRAQYAACMDNYCNVLDDNQGRCSCSKNLKNYEKTEASLAAATEEFQNVIQKIKYIGLTSTQIESLFTETEAEVSMKSNSDSSRLKNSLDAIKKKIVDVSSPSSSGYVANSGISMDLNGLLSADFTGGFDLSSFLGTGTGSTSSVSNQRGEQLYKTAMNRCKVSVLNSCTNQGIDPNVITNSYDLEIDKQCMAYERSLNEANTEMKNNVMNAANILQQARLMLTQNKNSYDLRGCIAAIDSCMQDDYICGSDYELCLDPTGKYLANGEIVKGGTPGVSGGQNKNTAAYTPDGSWKSGGMYNLYATWNYDSGSKNAWSIGESENLGGYIDEALLDWKSNYSKSKDSTFTDNMATYLLQKIGYMDSDDKVHGMCASVMKQCQDYTYTNQKSNKKYIPANEVVRQYLNSTLAKIKVQQDAILADYAENCRSDVQSCLSTNGYDDSNTKSTASKTAVNACAAEITTCMSVGGYQVKDGTRLTLRAMTDWVSSILINCPTNHYLEDDGIGDGSEYDPSSTPSTSSSNPVSCKSCPKYYIVTGSGDYLQASGHYYKTSELSTSAGGQATRCSCPEGFTDGLKDNKPVCVTTATTVDSQTMEDAGTDEP